MYRWSKILDFYCLQNFEWVVEFPGLKNLSKAASRDCKRLSVLFCLRIIIWPTQGANTELNILLSLRNSIVKLTVKARQTITQITTYLIGSHQVFLASHLARFLKV